MQTFKLIDDRIWLEMEEPKINQNQIAYLNRLSYPIDKNSVWEKKEGLVEGVDFKLQIFCDLDNEKCESVICSTECAYSVAYPLTNKTKQDMQQTIPEHKKYSSPYPTEVIYRSDKNFDVRLKVMVDKALQGIGVKVPPKFFEQFENAEEYLFASKDPSEPSDVQGKEGEALAIIFKRYIIAVDKIYNDTEESRRSVIEHLGIHHLIQPDELDKIIERSPTPNPIEEKQKEDEMWEQVRQIVVFDEPCGHIPHEKSEILKSKYHIIIKQ